MSASTFDGASTQFLEQPDGASIAFRVVANTNLSDDTHTLLVFNGAFFNMALWRHAVNVWASTGLRCVLQDVRGAGESQAAVTTSGTEVDQFTFDTYCDDAARLIQHLGLRRVVVVGMAWGSRVAALFAVRYAKFTEACVLFDISLGNSLTPEHSGAQKFSLRLARDKAARLKLDEPEPDKDMTFHSDRKTTARAMAATSKAPYNDPATFVDIVAAGILCPTLVAMGEFDPNLVVQNGGARAVVTRLRRRLPVVELEILEAAGHASVKTNPRQCARCTAAFVGRLHSMAGSAAL